MWLILILYKFDCRQSRCYMRIFNLADLVDKKGSRYWSHGELYDQNSISENYPIAILIQLLREGELDPGGGTAIR